MKPKELIIRAYLKNVDSNHLTFLFFADDTEPFTKKFLTEYYNGQNSSITDSQFKVKYISSSAAYKDKAQLVQIPIHDLIGQSVEAHVLLKHYNFISNGKKIIGWNLTLLYMNPF